ncbi:MAG: 4-(cytidine 5'-diphospho)-2-C-methyl-D-erythritol kinase [Halarcobacter sp.]
MIKKSYAKVNIFLKIAGRRENYHELVSRFVRVHSLYDLIKIEKKVCDEFTLVGNFGCETKKNTIYKAYMILKEESAKVEEYFKKNCVIVEKHIPEFAGLGGGSSNCATFMIMVNELCNLNLSKDELAKLAITIGADVPFFIYEYNSANVTGIGEIVEKYEEEVLDIETITPQIKCNTGEIFKVFRNKFYKEIDEEDKKKLLSLNSKQILNILDINRANDLFEAAKDVYKDLNKYEKQNWYFSGSGSSFFKVKK